LNISDCNMQEGSLRFDANISVMKKNETRLRTKIEIKNMNSFSNMGHAIEAEIHRQIDAYIKSNDSPDAVSHATYRWDPDTGKTVLMRRKEEANDYRYFPEPDLVPIVLSEAYIDEVRALLPELPLQRKRRYIDELGLSNDKAFILTSNKKLADYFEKALKHCSNARSLCNWIVTEFAGKLKDTKKALYDTGITAENIAALITMIDNGTITGRIAKRVADDMLASPEKSCQDIINENADYQPLSDKETLEPLIDDILKKHQQSVLDYKAGKNKAFAFLVGQVMKQTKGKASPQLVNNIIKEKINEN